ncbi:MAG: Do family serine endopeptidase [Planctomycetaceae bacterium]|nr:Do family serine endopeptidase [Planctomycetaceae bacterium]
MKVSSKGAVCASILLALVLSLPAKAAETDTNGIETLRKTSKAFSGVAKKAVPSVVAVQVRSKVQGQFGSSGSPFDEDFFERFFGRRFGAPQQPRQPQWREGNASGFIISADGYVLTNHHVVDGADEVNLTLNDGRKYNKVKVIGSDEKADVALLKIENVQDLPFVEMGDSDSLEIGEWVIAIGNPFGLTETLTVGVVSAMGRKLGGEDVYQDFIQTDAAINPGNSGGPLLNLDGQVVGINSAIVSGTGGYMGIGLAVPINMAKSVQSQLASSGKVSRGYLGISMQEIKPEMAEFFKLENNRGALINDVSPDSPADKAGLKKDDVITQIGSKKIEDVQDVKNIVGFSAPGTTLEITVVRNGKEKVIQAEVGVLEDSELAGTSDTGKKLGLEVATVDKDIASEYRVREGEGVMVTGVEPGSDADYAGIRQGMVILAVNRQPIKSVSEFNAALKESEQSKKALLLVKTGRYAQYIVLQFE